MRLYRVFKKRPTVAPVVSHLRQKHAKHASSEPPDTRVPRNHKRTLLRKSLSQANVKKRNNDVILLSQPLPSTSTNISEPSIDRRSQNFSSERAISEEENQLVNRVLRYLLVLDRGRQIVSKPLIIKNALSNQGKHFARVMNKVKSLLSKIFGYRLVEFESNKYILVNEVQNELTRVQPFVTKGSRQVLLFVVLVHIFMHEDSCTEESLWNFLTNLGIPCSNNHYHAYFGNVKYLITELFVAQKYLDRIAVETNDSTKVEFKWGPRAEHEFSRRAALDFVSQVYNGRPINSWPLQFKSLNAREKSNKPY